MLKLAPSDAAWLELFPAQGEEPAVEVQFAAITIKAVRAARRAVAVAFRLDRDDAETAGDALSRELIRRGILDWRGIGNEAGVAIEVSPATIEAFLDDPRTYEAADRVYVMPWVKRDLEGNASSASPSGTGEAETPAADIASSAAVTPIAADASPTTSIPTGSVPTSSSSPKPKRARRSGKLSRAARPS